ncbi:armadillo-type protein [Bisporella sp. PMI_857]|nr:armadillo-type protein [Bisporella sp. PMI_857]
MANLGINDGALPTSFQEVEASIIQMYQPGAKVSHLQEKLQKLQRSPEGWQLAQTLLNSKEEVVRFFGALTFTVKLNTDSSSLTDSDVHALLQSLIIWLIRSLEKGEGVLVIRKLCSTLAAFFIQFSTTWTRCLKHILYCLCLNQAVPYSNLTDAPETALLVQNISNEKAIIVFWFISTLVEDVGKMDSSSMKTHRYHQQVVPNVNDVVPLIERYATNSNAGVDVKCRQEAMKCFQAWVSYSHRAFIDDEVVLDPLKSLTKHAIIALVDDTLYEITIELISDILSNYSKFLEKDDIALLYSLFGSQWAQERYQRLVNGDFDFDSIQFGLFMIAFGDANVEELAQKAGTEPQCQQLLTALGGLLGAEGYAVNDDKIFVPALEFWSTFVECMVDVIYSSDGGKHPLWFSAASEHVMQAVRKCWLKIQFPPPNVFDSWDSVDQTGFKDARRDVCDLLEQFYLISDISLLNVFIDYSQQSIATRSWTELEASLYCLSMLSDCIRNHTQEDEYLHRVFDPSLVSLLTSHQDIPVRTSYVFLSLIREYSEYFERYTGILPQVLNIVFASAVNPYLAKNASWAIKELCSKCRTILVPELGVFLQQLANMSSFSLDSHVKEGIIQGIASIVQAIGTEEGKVAPLEQLLHFIEADVDQCLRLISSYLSSHPGPNSALPATNSPNDYNTACELDVAALRCLAAVADGLQVPTDIPVDLEKKASRSTFWISGGGSIIQQRILSIINKSYDALSNRSDVIEAICRVFRGGFRELDPGPFVFTSATVAQVLLKANLQTPSLGHFISAAGSLISSHMYDEENENVADVLLKWNNHLLQSLAEPSNDPDIAQRGVELLSHFVSTYPGILLSQDSSILEIVFVFTLKALTGSDPLPKYSSAEFWTTFVGLQDLAVPLQLAIDSALLELGPLLSKALIHNFGGNAARSELDRLCEPLKKLVVRQMRSKNWLETALLNEDFPSDKVTTKDKTIFLQKIISLRGAKGTAQVVRDFWLTCRGQK